MSHPHLVYSVQECEQNSLLKGKITLIIETFDSHVDRLLASVLSVLLRSKDINGVLEHIIVCIHGPDERTGSTKIQDKKQAFLEELRVLKWQIPGSNETRDMPLTITRSWSRIGHGQALEQAVAWVHTEAYVLMADDYVIIDSNWVNDIKTRLLDQPDVGYLAMKPWGIGACENPNTKNWQLHMPRVAVLWLAIKKSVAEQVGLRWSGYFLTCKFSADKELIEYHKPDKDALIEIKKANYQFGELIIEQGAWAHHLLQEAGIKCGDMPDALLQNRELSWYLDKEDFLNLEADIRKSSYWELYSKYQSSNKIQGIIESYRSMPINPNMKVVVVVCVYNRIREIINWMRAWNNANHYGCKLAIVHSWGELNQIGRYADEPNQIQSAMIQKFGPDYYLPRFNIGMDIRALYDLKDDPRMTDWDAIVWFTDDCLPMDKDFLMPFMANLSKPEVGLVGAFPEVGYYRTVSFGIKKEVMQKIPWINNGDILSRTHCLQMENQLESQVKAAGYKTVSILPGPGSENYVHWSRFSDWVWDSDSTQELNMWYKFEQQFPAKDRISGSLQEIKDCRARYGQALIQQLNVEKSNPNHCFSMALVESVLKKNGLLCKY